MMNEAYELEFTQMNASFFASPFDLVLGVERQSTLIVPGDLNVQSFTDVEWQILYCRVLIEDRWCFLPQTFYDEIDDTYGDLIGDRLWTLTQQL